MAFGAYRIVHRSSGRSYIGSTVDSFYRRFANHKNQLNWGVHTNKPLQRAWQRYGATAFAFEILECSTDPADVLNLEQKFLDMYPKKYNILKIAGSAKGRPVSQSEKRKIAATKSKRIWTLISPSGRLVKIRNLAAFARKNKLDMSGLYKVARGQSRQIHGWKHPVRGMQPKRHKWMKRKESNEN